MNGPEHYREAERLLRNAQDTIEDAVNRNDGTRVSLSMEVATQAAAIAQAHATLALVAATAEPWVGDVSERTGDYLHREWVEAVS